jgi:hypothetical protein
MRVGELTAGAGLAAMLAVIAAAAIDPGPDNQLLDAGVVLVPVVILGAGMYVAGDSALSAPTAGAPSDHPRSWHAAMDLARRAKHAARTGDCAEVQAIEPRVRELDDDIYGRFLRDPVIKTCLPPAPPP